MSIKVTSKEEFLGAVDMMRLIAVEAGRVAAFQSLVERHEDLVKTANDAIEYYNLFFPRVCGCLYQFETDEDVKLRDYYKACVVLAEDFGAVVYVLEYLDAKVKMISEAEEDFELRSPWRLVQGYRATRH